MLDWHQAMSVLSAKLQGFCSATSQAMISGSFLQPDVSIVADSQSRFARYINSFKTRMPPARSKEAFTAGETPVFINAPSTFLSAVHDG